MMGNKERDEAIWKMRCEGAIYSVIAKRFCISSDRVRQICSRFQRKERIKNSVRRPFLEKD